MLFNSIDFAVFLPIVFLLYWFVFNKNLKHQNTLLVAASYLFYGWWDWRFLSLIIFSTVVDYSVGVLLSKEQSISKRKLLLWVSIIVNLGFLGFFKYYNFFLDNFVAAFSLFGSEIQPNSLQIILPVGISFYTFQTMSYTIDVYNGKLIPEKHFGKFALYVSFFPQLVAGPIERATNLLPQLQSLKRLLNHKDFVSGISQIIVGLFKKVVVADLAASYVNLYYNNFEFHSGFALLVGTYLFAIQIYCDFSGYSDIAIGTARMLGFRFMDNFRTPYYSKSITELWRRWHISLSSWLRDYLYIPLGGNRKGKFNSYRNVMITMLLGGLWHGASWNFVIWGALNGVYLSVERIVKLKKIDRNKTLLSKLFFAFFTFNLVCLTWIFFRAQTFKQAQLILIKIVSWEGGSSIALPDLNVFLSIVFSIIILFLIEFFYLRKYSFEHFYERYGALVHGCAISILLLIILLFGVDHGESFIYFQF